MIPRVPTFLFLAYLDSVCLADDFKTTNGKEYKNATVSRVEPDGIVLKTKSGVTKLYFGELPKEVQERFRYDPAQAGQFNAAQQGAVTQQNAAMAEQQQQQEQRRRAQEIKKNSEAIKKNVRTVQEVKSDQASFLDQPLLLGGTIRIDNFYSYGYEDAEQTHYCFDITDSTGESCHAYMERENAGNLRQQLLSAGTPLKGVFTVVLLSRRYNASSNHPGLFVELLDYRLER
jgi:type II secretory pathway pseudopilin PulG